MRKGALADYLQDNRCPVSSAKAGHIGGPGRCPACEMHLRNPAVRKEVEAILKSRNGRRVAAQRTRSRTTVRRGTKHSSEPPRSRIQPVGVGVPVEHAGLVWWFDAKGPKEYGVFYWDPGADRVAEWTGRDRNTPPEPVRRGFARAQDASTR